MSSLIKYLQRGYYTDLFLTVTLFLVFAISLGRRKKHPQFKFLPFYFSAFFIFSLFSYVKISFFSDSPFRKNLSVIADYIDAFVTLTEFFAFMYMFNMIIINTKKKRLIKWLTVSALVIFIFIISKHLLFDPTRFYPSLTYLYILESSILVIPCAFYYYELFVFSPRLDLLQDANFWTVTGLTFYLFCTLPLNFVLYHYMKTNYLIYVDIFSIINLFYVLLFVMIIKSYLCKKTSLM